MGRIIYLPHPGGEHLSKNPGYKFDPKSIKKLEKGTMPWNNADKHARKFICSEGDYLDSTGKLHEQEKIAFWGEMEI